MKLSNKKPIVLFDIDHTLFDTEKFKESKLAVYSLYEEVLNILEKLSKIAELGILSQGELGFQTTKLKNTSIGHFFKEHNVHVFEDKNSNLEKALLKYKNYKIFFLDDRLDILYTAKKFMSSVVVIWINRGPHAKKQEKIEGFAPDYTLYGLQEIENIIRAALI